MIKGDMCLKIIEKGKPKDVIIKEGEVTWILSMVGGVLSGTQLEHASGDKSQRQITSCILKNLSPWNGVQNEISLNLCSLLHTRVVIRSRGFSLATERVAPGYFYWKIEEKWNQKKSLAIWFSAYLLYLHGSLKS